MNYALCFSTIKTILDWVATDPSVPPEIVIKGLEELRDDVELKLETARRRAEREPH